MCAGEGCVQMEQWKETRSPEVKTEQNVLSLSHPPDTSQLSQGHWFGKSFLSIPKSIRLKTASLLSCDCNF